MRIRERFGRRLTMPVICAVLVGIVASAAGAQSPVLRMLPTRYVGDRFFAAPVTASGDTLVMLIDTGGGQEFVAKATLEHLGFTLKFALMGDGDSVFTGGKFPPFRPDAWIPVPIASRDSNLYGIAGDLNEITSGGMLGNKWMAGRVWVFDYPRHQLSMFASPPSPRAFGPHTIPMTLRDPPRTNHPRITVIVAGDSIDMLLDTGATSTFTPDALAKMDGGVKTRASAFVSTRRFDSWHSRHPEWRVVAHGESGTNADIIEVPSLMLAGYSVGPIWFAKRPNSVYDGMMKAIMDKPIEASIGGQAFRTFRVILDYPNQRVTFER